MAKVHPNAVAPADQPAAASAALTGGAAAAPPTVLTVWRKSLLFNCDGFTVYDARGDLAFRVDCYGGGRRRRGAAEVVLMDAGGKPLLTVRRERRLSGRRRWVIYDGDEDRARPLLSVRRGASASGSARATSRCNKALARVAALSPAAGGNGNSSQAPPCSYVVEGSYARRACAVRGDGALGGAVVAEVQRKESVGDDVFRLVAGPGLGAPLAVALVIALDDMSGSGSGRGAWSRRPS